MEVDLADDVFTKEIIEYVSSLNLTCKPCILRSAKGCYPTSLLSVLDILGEKYIDCDWHARSEGWDVPIRENFFPHVLDGDWRYSRPAVAKLLDLAVRQGSRESRFLHFGSPSTYKAALKAFPNSGHHWLYDRNAVHHGAHSIDSGGFAFDVAIIDPPWYPEDTVDFLKIARSHLRKGAKVFVAQPAELTRPGVLPEREHLLAELLVLGYHHVVTRPNFVRYETPHFEWVTLNSQVSQRIPADWRLGDLLIFEYNSLQTQENYKLSDNTEWLERRIGPLRFRIRAIPSANETTFSTLTLTGFAPSVSRRDPVRSNVGIWTSGNRIFTCSSIDTALSVLREIEKQLICARLCLRSCIDILQEHGLSIDSAEKSSHVIMNDIMEHLSYAV